jgi:RimJ/RimL family protein N-acetyltransferase
MFNLSNIMDCKYGSFESTLVQGWLADKLIKTISPDCKYKDELILSIQNGTATYISGFKVKEEYQGQGYGYKMHIASISTINLPKRTKHIFLFVDRDNIKALNMHMKADGRICGYWNGTEGYGPDYLIYYHTRA